MFLLHEYADIQGVFVSHANSVYLKGNNVLDTGASNIPGIPPGYQVSLQIPQYRTTTHRVNVSPTSNG
jgi:hypothetical protein